MHVMPLSYKIGAEKYMSKNVVPKTRKYFNLDKCKLALIGQFKTTLTFKICMLIGGHVDFLNDNKLTSKVPQIVFLEVTEVVGCIICSACFECLAFFPLFRKKS